MSERNKLNNEYVVIKALEDSVNVIGLTEEQIRSFIILKNWILVKS